MTDCGKLASWYLTLPLGASPYRLVRNQNPPINELFWPNRHSYRLSSPGVQGELPWIVFNGFTGTFTPNLGEGADSILTERAVFQRGKTTTALRPDAKTLSAQVSIVTPDRCEFDRFTSQALAHIMSTDIATSIPCDGEYEHDGMDLLPDQQVSQLSFAYEQPSPWRLTYETCFDGDNPVHYHRNISAMWLANDPDFQGDAHSLSTELVMYAPDGFWFGNVVQPVANNIYATQQVNLPALANVPAIDANAFGDIYYNGTARTGWTLRFVLDNAFGALAQITAISIVDVTDPANLRWQRFPHVNFPNNGWVIPAGATVVWSSEHQVMFFDNGGVVTEGLHLQASVEYARQWSTYHFVPGRTYQIVLETNYQLGGFQIVTNDVTLSYNEKYSGIL